MVKLLQEVGSFAIDHFGTFHGLWNVERTLLSIYISPKTEVTSCKMKYKVDVIYNSVFHLFLPFHCDQFYRLILLLGYTKRNSYWFLDIFLHIKPTGVGRTLSFLINCLSLANKIKFWAIFSRKFTKSEQKLVFWLVEVGKVLRFWKNCGFS